MHTSDHLLSAYLARYLAVRGSASQFFLARVRTPPCVRAPLRDRGAAQHERPETRLTCMEQDLRRAWDEELRSHGYRVTPQRQLVLEAVAKLDHATPEEIAASVQQTASGVNISTIYRTLELLDNLGLVRHTHLNHGAPTYHLASDADHVHLVCQDCGRVFQVSPDAIRPLIVALDEGQGFETDVAHLTVFGRCRECRGKINA
jgi:Fur family transcriptional regulator, ferric uptake regulator